MEKNKIPNCYKRQMWKYKVKKSENVSPEGYSKPQRYHKKFTISNNTTARDI